MKNDANIHLFLRVYNRVTSQGQKQSQGYLFDGITAGSDFEGYTVTLTDGRVTLTIFFHNKFEFDYPNKQALEGFLRHLKRLDERH